MWEKCIRSSMRGGGGGWRSALDVAGSFEQDVRISAGDFNISMA